MDIGRFFVEKMLRRWEKNDTKKLAGKPLPGGIIAMKDIPYANDTLRGHKLDIYMQENPSEKLPVLVDIHGGGFMSGYKELDRLFGYHMAQKGFLVYNLNYRLAYFDTTIPGQVQDIALAAQWIFDNLEQCGGDKSRVFLCGHSAGAVLALMEALASVSPRVGQLFDDTGSGRTYAGIVLDCGLMAPYKKSLGYWGMRSMCFEKGYQNQDYYRAMVWPDVPEIALLPKVYLISNAKDELRRMTLDFNGLLDARGVEHKMNYQTGKGLGHMAVIYNPGSPACAEILDEMAAYLLAPPAAGI